jgi:4-hydroxythreonine-4-phosphate dehydrogenase
MARRRKTSPLIGLSIGDPAGIGPEVVLKAAAAIARRDSAPALIAIGDLAVMSDTAVRLPGVPRPVEWCRGESLPPDALPVMALGKLSAQGRRPGKPTVEGGDASFRYVEAGAQMARAGEIDALVTAPISKQWWDRAGHDYPGHSELLAKIARARHWRMMFAGSDLRLALVTVHVALAKVAVMLTAKSVFDTIAILDRHLRENEGAARPRIGVLGFNPHAGEAGLFGTEEISIIAPAIRRAQRRGIDAFGPLAPDTAFVRPTGRFGFDAAVAMYHDQGLIALKTLEFDRAVNVTIGLPFIRTSPDHGTAFDIAGQGRADPSSLIEAVLLAARLAASSGAGTR